MKLHIQLWIFLNQVLELLDDGTEGFGFTFRSANYLELFVDPTFEDILILG
jgi:hypothetical protein